MNRSLLLLVLMPLCVLADNPLETQEATGTDSKHARDTSDILKDLEAINRNRNRNKSILKKGVLYYGGEYYAMLDDKISTAKENQSVTIIKQRTDSKVIYKQLFERSLRCNIEMIAIIKDRKTGETESITISGAGIEGRIKNEEKVYEILKGLYKNYRSTDAPWNNSSVASSPWKWGYPERAEAHYAELKLLVFAKMGPDFATAFNKQYPQSSKKAVKELARHFDCTTGWLETYPPQTTATIGSQKIALEGEIALIIYDAGIKCN